MTTSPSHLPVKLPPRWNLRTANTGCRSFELSSHRGAVAFVVSVCGVAMQHRPQIAMRFRDTTVFIEIPVHEESDKEGVVALAQAIDDLESDD